MRRLGRVIGQCVALTPAPNVAEKNRIKAKGRLRFFGARTAHRAVKRIQFVKRSALLIISWYLLVLFFSHMLFLILCNTPASVLFLNISFFYHDGMILYMSIRMSWLSNNFLYFFPLLHHNDTI
jgi:hypothetical protein